MNLLLDTHVALWAITDSPKLPEDIKTLVSSPRATVWVSAASIWEIAIKHSLGRGDMPVSSDEATGYFRESGYQLLDITPEHAVAVEALPNYHSDPFDRMIVAQALVEPLRLVTHDQMVAKYSDAFLKI